MLAFSLALTMTTPNDQEIQNGDSSQRCPEWLISIMNIDGGPSDNTILYPKMEKVPKMLRDQMQPAADKIYDPLVVSIGPYHHGKLDLKSIEERKVHFARAYVESCEGKSITDVYNEVADVASEARKCYEVGSTEDVYDQETFTRMMFLDGCFILQFACQWMGDEKEEKIQMKSHERALVQRDLFLLENQLPFEVLQRLMSLRFGNDDYGLKILETFIRETRASPPKPSCWENLESFISKHLTDRKSIPPEGSNHDSTHPAHLLELWRRQLVNPKAFTNLKVEGNNDYWYSYRSVQELKTSGIHFRPNKTSRYFTDARYEDQKFRAILRLPPMTIDDSTESLLLNLVAYEMCAKGPSDLGVTSYVWFLDTLIDNAEDVKELRKMGILLNYLGSDEHVAELFNGIAKNLVPSHQAFADLKGKIERHYKNKMRLWVTEWINTHFTSPWSLAAFLGAIVSIIFSFIQAYKALYPSTAS